MILKGSMVKGLRSFWKKELYILLLFILFLPLFFYKLAQSSLVSWDEAWYAEIARNIMKTGDLFNLFWNGLPFSDKPPGGFWLEAISFKFFGISEFAARLPSATFGFLSLVVVYLMGSKLFNRLTGLLSALALISSFWFLYRARFGDLDTILTFFYLLSIYLAVLASEKRKFLIPFSLSLATLPMVKGIVFVLALLPSLLIIFWGNKVIKSRDYLLPLLFLTGLFGTWILIQYIHSPALAMYHFSHSLRDSSWESNILSNLKLFKEYLHSGIGKWFWPGVLGIVVGFILRDRKLLAFSLFFFFYSVQFLFSPRIEIWHLIPVYPFMILSFFGGVYLVSKKIFKEFFFINVLNISIFVFTFYISLLQLKQMWYQFIDIPAFVSDEAILSKEASKYPYPFYIDNSFEPVAVFYSQKQAKWQNEYGLPVLLKKADPFVMIIKQSMLDKLKIESKNYKILKIDRDKILILYHRVE